MPSTHQAARTFILWLVLVSMVPVSASAVDLLFGWSRADIGLDGHDEGLTASLSHYLPMGDTDTFDMSLELSYVQRSGSQPELFASETVGFRKDERQITLHVIQPGITFGYKLETGNWKCRLYAGGAIGLKLEETDTLPEGDWIDLEPFGYEDIDYLVMTGLTATMGRLVLDMRYCAGLTDQLILRNELDYPTEKASEDTFPGVEDPVTGAKVSNFQLAAGFTF